MVVSTRGVDNGVTRTNNKTEPDKTTKPDKTEQNKQFPHCIANILSLDPEPSCNQATDRDVSLKRKRGTAKYLATLRCTSLLASDIKVGASLLPLLWRIQKKTCRKTVMQLGSIHLTQLCKIKETTFALTDLITCYSRL